MLLCQAAFGKELLLHLAAIAFAFAGLEMSAKDKFRTNFDLCLYDIFVKNARRRRMCNGYDLTNMFVKSEMNRCVSICLTEFFNMCSILCLCTMS